MDGKLVAHYPILEELGEGEAGNVFNRDKARLTVPSRRIGALALGFLLGLTGFSSSSLQAAPEAVPHALGEQKIAVLVAEIPGVPISTSMQILRDIFFSKTDPSIDSYLREVSYGKTWATGDVFGPFLLSRAYGWENNEWNEALGATLKVAGSAVDLRNYNQLVLIYPVQGFANTWGGNAGHGCVVEGCPSGGALTVTFLGASGGPAPRDKVFGVALHEFLHDMGEPHADTLDYAPETLGIPDPRYGGATSLADDPTVEQTTLDNGSFMNAADVMSAPMGGSSACSSTAATHLSAPLKYHLGWLDKGANVAEVEANGTFQLKPLETETSGLQALRVRRVPGSDLWLWIEYRQPVGLDRSLASCTPQAFNGVTAYYEMPAPSDPTKAVPVCPLGGRLCGMIGRLDFTPDTTPHDFRDAALASGKTWTDPYGPLTIRVGAAGADGLQVTISYETSCATFTPAIRAHGLQSETGTIQIAAPAGCNWTASPHKSSSWLTITSGKTGSGAGTIAYTAAMNDTYRLRNGWIVISRQVFSATQDYERVAPSGEKSDPNNGRSAVAQPQDPGFDFYYVDKNGGNDIRRAFVVFGDQPDARDACEVEYDVLTMRLRVADEAGTGWSDWSQPWGVPSWPNPGNSRCEVRFAAPAGPGGIEFYTSFHFYFKAPFAGVKKIFLKAVDADGMESAWVQVGTWTIYVNQPPAAVSVQPASGSGSSQTFQLVYQDPNGWSDLASVQMIVGAATSGPRCLMALTLRSSSVYLEADGGGWQSAMVAGHRGVLQNQYCAVDVSGVSSSGSGSDLTLTLPIVFNSKFAGAKNVYGYATDTIGKVSGWSKVGAWNVPQVSCAFALEPSAVAAGPDESKTSIRVTASASCGWIASSSVPWIDITGGLSGAADGTVSFTVLTNPLASQRIGRITVGGESVQVTQAGRAVALGIPSVQAFFNAGSFVAIRNFPVATWITITGTDLAPVTRAWNEEDFAGNKLPTQLNGVSVAINGRPAYIFYISPTQLNILTPDDDGQQAWNLRVTTPGGSEPYTHGLIKATYSPAFFMLTPEGGKYIAGRHQDGILLAKAGLYPSLPSQPAKPGETVMLFGTGFGPTQPACPASDIVATPSPTATAVTIRVGGQIAEVKFAGLVSSGLYQFNVVVPSSTPDGDQRVVADIAGIQSQANAYITVQK